MDTQTQMMINKYLNKNMIVFTCTNNSKIANLKWKNLTQSTFNKIKTNPNYALMCGQKNNLTVVDIDVKNKGLETFNKYLFDNGLSLNDFVYQTTPSGGLHILFDYTTELKTTTNLNNVSIDIRSEGSYILIEPSIIDGKKYTMYNFNNDNVIHAMPDSLIKFLNSNEKVKKEKVIKENDNENDDSNNKINYTNTNINLFDKLFELIPNEFYDDYNQWLSILCICRTIYNKKDGLKKAHELSCKSSKYVKDEVDMKYKTLNKEIGYGFNKLKEICFSFNKNKALDIINIYKPSNFDEPKIININKFYEFNFNDKYNIYSFLEEIQNKTFIVKCMDDLYDIIESYIKPLIVKLPNEEYIYKTIKNLVISNDSYINDFVRCKVYNSSNFTFETSRIQFSTILKKCKLFTFDNIVAINKSIEEMIEYNLFNISTPLHIETIENDNTYDENFLEDWIKFVKEIICNDEQEHYDFIINYMKNIFLKKRNYTALLLFSEKEGTGKNFFINFIEQIIGKSKVETGALTEIVNPQVDLSKKLLILINELSVVSQEKRGIFDKMKDLITGTNYKINQKFLQPKTIELNTSLILTSNNENSLIINKFDRRYSILNVSDKRCQDRKYFSILDKKYNNENGYKNIFNYVINYKINVDTNIALITDQKKYMVEKQDSIASYINDIKNNMWVAFKNLQNRTLISGLDLYEDYKNWQKVNPYTFLCKNAEFLNKIKDYGDVFEYKRTSKSRVYIFLLVNENNNIIEYNTIEEVDKD